jgi:import receptor subunit TOM70
MSTSPSSGPSQSLVERAQTWVSDNKKAVIIGSAAAAIAIGAGIYIATAGPPSKPSKRSKDSSKSAPKKRKPAKDVDTPILEEKKPASKVEIAPGMLLDQHC